jgi:RNA polymerase II subunit A small phosphatase-like protein
MHIKDLRILLGRDLKNVILVDNSVHSFAYQVENGIPILPWYSDMGDTELLKLMDYL